MAHLSPSAVTLASLLHQGKLLEAPCAFEGLRRRALLSVSLPPYYMGGEGGGAFRCGKSSTRSSLGSSLQTESLLLPMKKEEDFLLPLFHIDKQSGTSPGAIDGHSTS